MMGLCMECTMYWSSTTYAAYSHTLACVAIMEVISHSMVNVVYLRTFSGHAARVHIACL